MVREVSVSSPSYPVIKYMNIEVHTGRQEAFIYQEGGQTLQQASQRGGRCPRPLSV